MRISVRVIPRSSKNEIIQLTDGSFKARLTAAPVDGAANDALIKLLAEYFKVSKSSISIIRGETGRNKIIEVI